MHTEVILPESFQFLTGTVVYTYHGSWSVPNSVHMLPQWVVPACHASYKVNFFFVTFRLKTSLSRHDQIYYLTESLVILHTSFEPMKFPIVLSSDSLSNCL